MPGWHLSGLLERLRDRGQLVSEPRPAGRDEPAPRAHAASAHDPDPDPAIEAIRYDSRLVRPGDLFVARRGQRADGHAYVAEAVASRAAALIVERPQPGISIPQLVVDDARVALGLAAAWRAGDSSQRLGIVGVTGTDGKTTTCHMVRAVLEAGGAPAGLIGTTDIIIGDVAQADVARTSTPEAPELQAALAAMLTAGDGWAVVESTSHGLAQERVAGVAYDVAVLTNITSEHLELHGTVEAYRAAKHGLFARLARDAGNPEKGWGKHAVVNADDEQGDVAAATASRAGAEVVRYGLADRGQPGGPPDVAATAVASTASGLLIGVRTPGWSGEIPLRLAGRFNAHNALAAMAVAHALGLDLGLAAAALTALPPVAGRMQRIDEGQPFTVIVDYAHTAEALARVLDELAPPPPGGLIAVFGSAGERDVAKRAAMGRAAGERCRLMVLTDEDPRGEDRLAILEAIAAGAATAGRQRGRDVLLVPDRLEAIRTALGHARPGDAVLLAGKGHEKTIELADGDIPWDEAAAARAALRSLGAGSPGGG